MFTDNLDSYKQFPDTTSCYLDGRYFNKVFHKYPGLVREPLHINIIKDEETGNVRYEEWMKDTPINNNYVGLLRVIINTNGSRHSNLVLIDYRGKKIFRFDPYGRSSLYFDDVNKIIENYLDRWIDFDMYVIENPVYDQKNPDCVAKEIKGGFCVAYVIKFAYDYLNGRSFDPSHILKFASMIKKTYGPLPETGKDVEYGLFDSQRGRNVLIGGIGGVILGGALTGSATGAIVGGISGSLIGSII